MGRSKEEERAHCEAVAREAFEKAEAALRHVKSKRPGMVLQSINDYVSEALIAELIARERAAARREAFNLAMSCYTPDGNPLLLFERIRSLLEDE